MLHHKRKLEGEGFGVEAAGGASPRPEQRGECKSAGKDCQSLEEGQQTSPWGAPPDSVETRPE